MVQHLPISILDARGCNVPLWLMHIYVLLRTGARTCVISIDQPFCDERLTGFLDAVVDGSLHRGQFVPPSSRLLHGLQSRLPRSRAQDAALPQGSHLRAVHLHHSWMVYRVRLCRGLISCETKAALVPQDC